MIFEVILPFIRPVAEIIATNLQICHSSKNRRRFYSFLIAGSPTDFKTQVLKPMFQSAKLLSSRSRTPHNNNDGYFRRLLPTFPLLFHGIVVVEIICLSLSLPLSPKSLIENNGQEAILTTCVGADERGGIAG